MSEPTTEGIPPEIREKLDAERKTGVKKLPPIVTSASATESELPPVLTGSALEDLVNENPELAETLSPLPDVVEQAERYRVIIKEQGGEIKSLKKQIAELKESTKGGSKLEESRKFRIFLAFIEGFAARGDFSSETLIKGGGGLQGAQKMISERAQHAANLVEHTHRAIGNLPEAFRF